MYLKEPLDFEAAQTHTITIQVADQGISPQKISSATLTVNVLNVNDNAPVCVKFAGASLGITVNIRDEYRKKFNDSNTCIHVMRKVIVVELGRCAPLCTSW